MSLDDYTLDDPQASGMGQEYVTSRIATKGQRLATYLIDYFIVGAAFQVLSAFIPIPELDYTTVIDPEDVFPIMLSYMGTVILLSIAVSVLYFSLMEIYTGKTVGKMAVKTKVVTLDGAKPSNAQIIGRSFARFIPFEQFSFLGSQGIGWHDTLSGTRVIEDK